MISDRIAFIGGGNMGRALLAALRQHGQPAETLRVADAHAPTRETLARDLGVAACADNLGAVEGAGIVVLAVKPQDMAGVVTALRPALQRDRPILISIAAGLRCADIDGWSGGGLPLIRAMPNRPALVGGGATALFAAATTPAAARRAATAVFAPSGLCVWIDDEAQMDAVTALSGSGPAYFFLLAETMADAGVALGLPRETARELAMATLHGAGLMAGGALASGAAGGDGNWAIPRLRAEVTSRGGTTEAAVRQLETGDLRGLMLAAMRAAAERGRELAAQAAAPR
ncbi:MAG: pyrroline-5-carboxylate reductase [Steroidobacteraceae bacterium]